MEDKIEVGEWVRLKDGRIRVFKNMLSEEDVELTRPYNIAKIKDIVKHSKNIFKLLEGEDITVLEYYVGKYRKRIARRFEVFKAGHLISFRNVYCDFLYDLNEQKFLDGKGFNPKIKSIVTHEQFESMKYTISK